MALGAGADGKFRGIFSEDSDITYFSIIGYHLRIFTCNLLTPLMVIPSDLVTSILGLSGFTCKVSENHVCQWGSLFGSRQL